MRKLPFNKSIVIGGAVVAASLIGSAALDLWDTKRLTEGTASVAHAQEVLNLTSVVLRTLVDAESAVRGFLLTGKDDFLEPYDDATKRLDEMLAQLEQQTADNPQQQARFEQLKQGADARMNRLQQAIALRRTSVEAAQNFVASGQGKSQMDALRKLAAEIDGVEQAVLQNRERDSRRLYVVAQTAATLSAALGLLMLAAFCWLLYGSFEDAKKIQAAEALKEVDRRKSEFMAMLAHELRSPLAPIRQAADLLEADSGVLRPAHAMIKRQVDHMSRLIDDLLDISRIASGKLQLRREPIDLAAVVQSAVEQTRPLIEAAGHELTVSLPAAPVYLDADPTRIKQVLSNLLNNAAKYTERGGQIRIAAERQDESVVVSIRDTGIGIAADQLDRIFEMFSQVAPAMDRSQGGLGIGLALVRKLVELHGGTAVVRSDGAGKGSEFVVRMPAIDAPAVRTNAAVDRLQETIGTRSGRRILVVDDDVDAATSLAMLLRRAGHEVRAVHDGLEAVEATAAFGPDVVLLDIGLPKMDGYEVAHQIRQQPAGNDITIIALTGWGQDEDKQRTGNAGFDHHLTKPVDVRALKEMLASLGVRRLECHPATKS